MTMYLFSLYETIENIANFVPYFLSLQAKA